MHRVLDLKKIGSQSNRFDFRIPEFIICRKKGHLFFEKLIIKLNIILSLKPGLHGYLLLLLWTLSANAMAASQWKGTRVFIWKRNSSL